MSNTTEKLLEFFSNHKVLNLAYTDVDGVPQSCALWYAHEENLDLIVLSSLSTKHGRTLQSGGNIAFTINKDDQDWREIQGVQGRGYIELLEQGVAEWNRYTSKYPFVANQYPDLDQALRSTKIWKIRPTWLRLIDNTVSFGHKEEISLGR